MATIKESFAAATTITCTLTSLASGSAQRSAVVDNSANLYDDAIVSIQITGGAVTTGLVKVYAYASADDGTTYEAGGSSDAAYTLRGSEKYLGAVATFSSGGIATGVFSIAKAYGGTLPRNWGVIVDNRSAAALAASGNAVKYQGVTKTVS